MTKYIKIFFSLLAAALLTGCSYDDLPWDGVRNTEDEVAIPFTNGADFEIESVTRGSATEASTDVDQIDLIVFCEGAYKWHQTYKKGTDFTDADKWVKVSRSKVDDGNWYLVANAGNKVSNFAAESNANRSEEQFKSTVLANESDVFPTGANAKALLYAAEEAFTVPAVNSKSQVFELRRLYSLITLKVSDQCRNFLVNGTRFYAEDTEVALVGTPSKKMKLINADAFYTPTGSNATSTLGQSHLSSDGEISFYVLPMATGMTTTATGATKYPEPRLLLKGRYATDVDDAGNINALDDKDTYFAYKFPQEIEAGHSYVLTLESILGQGPDEYGQAFDNPVGAVVKFEDKTAGVNNIITDGERVIAVQDAYSFDAGTGDVQTSITVYWRGKSDDVIKYPTDSIPGWITNISPVTSNDVTASAEETGKGLVRKKTTFSFTVKKNQGSEREFIWPFYFDAKKSLRVETTVSQTAAEIDLNDLFTINLEIKRGSSTELTSTNYVNFLKNTLKGISPDANGSRIRNNGLHAPMPNSESGAGVQYIYTITPKSGTWTMTSKPDGLPITGSGSWTITLKDTEYPMGSRGKVAYEVFKDGIVLEKSDKSQTINLDVYHTGFFSKSGSNWYYYEVFNAGGTYWLDRNVGATSAGMSHRTGEDLLTGSWPINPDAAGDYISLADAPSKCPTGWTLPTQGDYEKLAMQRTFSTDRLPTGASTIFVPNYRMSYTIYRGDRTQTATVENYFPHNMYMHSSDGRSGDEGAGYYLTSTGTDQAGYYRSMVFVGMNTTAETHNFGSDKKSRLMSLRCVSTAGASVDDETFTYSCQVKGYTHVFLYHVAADGTKTFLNTWPGQEVAIGDMVTKRYNPFSYTSYVSLTDNGGKLFVIFNLVESGAVKESNVIVDARNNRQGIPFMNGDAYDIKFINDEKLKYTPAGYSNDIVLKGNWKNNSTGQQTVSYEYRVWGSMSNNSDWKSLGTMTKNDDGSYTLPLTANADTQFVIEQRKTENNSTGSWITSWGKAPTKTTTIVANTEMSLKATTENDYNFRFSNDCKGAVTIRLIPSATHATLGSKLKVETGSTPPPTSTYKYVIKGNIWSTCSNSNDWQYNTTDLTEVNGIWCYKNVTVQEGTFGIGKFKYNETTFTDGTRLDWLGANCNMTPGDAVNSTVIKNYTSGNNNMTLKAGTYDIEINPTTSEISVIRKAAATSSERIGIWWEKNSIDKSSLCFCTSGYSPFWPKSGSWDRQSAELINNQYYLIILTEENGGLAAYKKLCDESGHKSSWDNGVESQWSDHHFEEAPGGNPFASKNLTKTIKIWK